MGSPGGSSLWILDTPHDSLYGLLTHFTHLQWQIQGGYVKRGPKRAKDRGLKGREWAVGFLGGRQRATSHQL